ncbi:complement component receptor 1-like protein [Bombina bombina]|uniref:complement component receptor 1-like protein n=1 Tax=Bombina bombina TaxID=8345 RepID=UPI00235A931C|nr:complement component receptor 1-like protein [Bombina bombina]XP_053562553.1 complement component receptor 1-like protein [Bombina bombina]
MMNSKPNAWNLHISAIFCLAAFHIFITTVHGISCPEPKVYNGKIIKDFQDDYEKRYKIMDIVKIKCNPFYSLKGDDTIVCGIDSKWHPKIPICQGWFDCPYPAIENGHIVLKNYEDYSPERRGHGFDWKDVVRLRCDSGYVMKGDENCYCVIGWKWSPDLPKCVPE